MFSIFKKKGVKGQISKGKISEPVISFLKAVKNDKNRFKFYEPICIRGRYIWKMIDKDLNLEFSLESSKYFFGSKYFSTTESTSFMTKDEVNFVYDTLIKKHIERELKYEKIKKERKKRDKRSKLKKVYCKEE